MWVELLEVASEETQVSFETDPESLAFQGARLLLGVARLGDGDLRAWWGGSVLDPDVGGFILGNAFPRTAKVAGAELLLLSAARRHRQILSRPNAVDLFSERMPFLGWTRAWLARQKTAGPDPLLDELASWRDPGSAQDALRDWSGPTQRESAQRPGTISLGVMEASELEDHQALLARARQLAACYAEMEALTPSYFDLAPARL